VTTPSGELRGAVFYVIKVFFWPIVLKNSAPENRQRTRASALRNSTEILI
jgi:hypothetical protein